MPKIIQLDRHVADLIAAGEVVDRLWYCSTSRAPPRTL